ncbi:hypothetical protein GCM10010421_33380 [Streptomyces glaucus]|uniref:Uncharacterized protein n=1 Tax=Streptomyces glaucus TaxID=284029 RepID=A0ABP5WZV6_9ACTN
MTAPPPPAPYAVPGAERGGRPRGGKRAAPRLARRGRDTGPGGGRRSAEEPVDLVGEVLRVLEEEAVPGVAVEDDLGVGQHL